MKTINLTRTDRDIIAYLMDVNYDTIKVTGNNIAIRLDRSAGGVFFRLNRLIHNNLVEKNTFGVYYLTPAGKKLAIELKASADAEYNDILNRALPKVKKNSQVAPTWARIITEKTGRFTTAQNLIDMVRSPDVDVPKVDKIIKGYSKK